MLDCKLNLYIDVLAGVGIRAEVLAVNSPLRRIFFSDAGNASDVISQLEKLRKAREGPFEEERGRLQGHLWTGDSAKRVESKNGMLGMRKWKEIKL